MSLSYVSRRLYFSAMHVYRNPSWSDEENRRWFGLCSNPSGHGHDYVLDVTVKGHIDPATGMVVNISEIDRSVGQLVEETLDGKWLDREHPYFQARIPTTENLVRYLWECLDGMWTECELHRVRVREYDRLFSEKERGSMIRLTRKYHFSAAHRLHAVTLSDEENRNIFGKCNNPNGHGHNYYLEVSVAGEPDPVTGMIIPLPELDAVVDRLVIQRFDHKHLNLDTEEFRELNPTAEHIVKVIWDLLKPEIPGLCKIGLYETEKNYFEYMGEPVAGVES